jgi:HSP20 family protein
LVSERSKNCKKNFSASLEKNHAAPSLADIDLTQSGSVRRSTFFPSMANRRNVMSSVMRHESWGAMPRLQEEINRLFGTARENDSSSATATWVPPVDIHEFADRFELCVDLPGVEPSTVELTLDGGVLTLSGERAKSQRQIEGELQGTRIERAQGHFHRRFLLPDTVDGEKVNASGSNGVLTVTIPKQAKAMPRRIQIGS